MDFLVVPTLTCRLLYVLVVLRAERRTGVHFCITEAPAAEWTAQQVINAFPYDTAPKCLLRDRDSIDGAAFCRRVAGLGIRQRLIAPRSPWQSPYVERLIGSIQDQWARSRRNHRPPYRPSFAVTTQVEIEIGEG